ncbi:SDR family oxidoreductase [Bacillus carboniphilus]|uniref:SDR family oxidoreductase n=1 Tax=Bacillus carboniphilus TaxID=86663 RepID=A0ABY9K0N3_9BACI|nr:SDR family oxidoreductase [Bacillus carboniphilus]WLR44250.1 SDR family oxidoreductase [Bacillus carboniphilus]
MTAMKKKTALITGASSGIGKEFAHLHAEQGGDLVIVARSEEKLKALKKELERNYIVNVMTIVKDLTLPTAPFEIYEQVNQAGVKIDYLINNAGMGGRGLFYERYLEKDIEMINLNVIALTTLTRLFLPGFVNRNEGKILNVSSTASLVPGPLQAVYFASKAYVTSFSNALAEELSDTDVTVTALLPGATETGFKKQADLDNTKMFDQPSSAKVVAEDGYKAMVAGKLNVFSGLTFPQRMQVEAIPFTPKKMLMKQIRQMQEKKS